MSNQQPSDNELIAIYQSGSQDAINQLLERHSSRIRSYIKMMVKDGDATEDILQETYVKALKSIDAGRYAESGRFVSWVLRIAHNISIDYFRSRRINRELNEREAGFDIISSIDLHEGSVEDTMERKQVEQSLRELVEQLPDEQRQVVKLRYFAGMSFKEISEHTDVGINTSLGRMRYALINLRRMIKERKLVLH